MGCLCNTPSDVPPLTHSSEVLKMTLQELFLTHHFLEFMKQNKIRPEWAADRERWFEMIQNVNPAHEATERWGEKVME